MPFFDETPEPEPWPDRPPPGRVAWKGGLGDTLGAPVGIALVLAQNDEVALLLNDVVAYPAGFSFNFLLMARKANSTLLHGRRYPLDVQFGIEFSNGSRVIASDGQWQAPPDGWVLRSMQKGGGDRRHTQSFWCEPLPPEGPMRVVVEWKQTEIAETSTEIDGSAIRTAGLSCSPLWPDDVDYIDDDAE